MNSSRSLEITNVLKSPLTYISHVDEVNRENLGTDGSLDLFWHGLSPSQVIQLTQEGS